MILPPFKRNFLQHALAVERWMRGASATGSIDPSTYRLDIECRGRSLQFQGQFVVVNLDGSIGFTPELGPRVLGFVSWLPYFNRVWPEAQDKLVFRGFAQAHGIRVPLQLTPTSKAEAPFILKEKNGSLCRGLRGPYAAGETVLPGPGSYAESFVFGQLVKAWFWNGEPVVVEIVPMPSVHGDGVRTVEELCKDIRPGLDAECTRSLCRLQGLDYGSVAPTGSTVVVEYRYMSELNPASQADFNKREEIRGTYTELQLVHAGKAMWEALPNPIRQDTMLTLDAVMDSQGVLWFLEANCNPQFHPAVYHHMLESLFPVPGGVHER